MVRLALLSSGILVGLVGCAPGGGWSDGDPDDPFGLFGEDVSLAGASGAAKDSDGDGVADAVEEELGLDPSVADSDGDGWDDGVEVDSFTDGTDASDHPYTGGWEIGSCRNDLEGTGDTVGTTAYQFELMDQFGDTVRLHDFCNRTVLLVSSATWCGPCQAEAPELGGWFDEHEVDGLMVITLLGENGAGQSPATDDLMAWATDYGLGHPVVADAGWDVTYRYVPPSFGIPTQHLIGPGGEILATDAFLSEAEVVANLP